MTVDGIIVDIVLLIMVVGSAAIGYRRGLIKIAFSLISSIVAIILILILCKPVTNFVMNHTELPNSIETAISNKIYNIVKTETSKSSEQVQIDDENAIKTLRFFLGKELTPILEQTSTDIVQTISHEVTQKIISVIVFFALFVIIKLILFILRTYLEWIADLPLLDVINSTGGMVYGIISGMFLIYVGLGIISLFIPIQGDTLIVKAIEESMIGSRMFNNNILLGFIFKFL